MENDNQNNNKINSLPEYKIRTMEGDLDKLKKGTDLPPEELPIAMPTEITLINPIEVDEKPTEVTEKPIVPHPQHEVKMEAPAPKTKPTRTPLPEIEDFIAPIAPEEEKTKEARIKELKKELKTEKIEKSDTKTNKKTLWLIILGIILLVLALLGFFYWQGHKTEPNQTPPPITNNEPQIPDSLIAVDETKFLKINNNISLLILLQDESKIEPIKTFRRIVPTKFSAITGKEEILTLNDLIAELNISVNPFILSEFKNDYTLVLYGQEENEKRLGLIIATRDNNIQTQSKSWEQTMVNDLYNLFLGKQPQIFTNNNFAESNYNGVVIRFINFPNPDLSIDYATPDNLFIVSTSKESIRAIIDRIK
ncbi:MAG TPA: hypothetical protein PLF70_02575 [Candidatus Portnoybacteria bacterium]|jgi:hypothetical protein|nr:hypothetical protein [Candidatus Portnoybacteria bacterium]MDD5752335.1 hypothetical protein [Candidatus Portnoybacteria bacterium]HOZ16668.1 hypothetical protein [Candidatus Portnoybacteria bacterium]HPH52394.1 hypothetical protein [Candidatus Portnoybacteria bacterium]HPJ80559.1 hypothetical protein [Candidatus Portnoybacteria bacterium]